MKTYRNWEDGPEMPITDYLQPGDEVDEEMHDHFGSVVFPQYLSGEFMQVGEADVELRGRYHYMTFWRSAGKCLYLGILPAFKQPKY